MEMRPPERNPLPGLGRDTGPTQDATLSDSSLSSPLDTARAPH